MLVYMLLNAITERAYVGATDKPLEERWARHVKEAMAGGTWRINRAIREWPDEAVWERVVLQLCYSVEELSAAETRWMDYTSVLDGAVGYNDHIQPYVTATKNGRKGGNPLVVGGTTKGPLLGLTPEQRREFFRECGRRGAVKSRSLSR